MMRRASSIEWRNSLSGGLKFFAYRRTDIRVGAETFQMHQGRNHGLQETVVDIIGDPLSIPLLNLQQMFEKK